MYSLVVNLLYQIRTHNNQHAGDNQLHLNLRRSCHEHIPATQCIVRILLPHVLTRCVHKNSCLCNFSGWLCQRRSRATEMDTGRRYYLDGGSANGSFVFDADTSTYSDIAIHTTVGTEFLVAAYADFLHGNAFSGVAISTIRNSEFFYWIHNYGACPVRHLPLRLWDTRIVPSRKIQEGCLTTEANRQPGGVIACVDVDFRFGRTSS
jgi:hypothetical protein